MPEETVAVNSVASKKDVLFRSESLKKRMNK